MKQASKNNLQNEMLNLSSEISIESIKLIKSLSNKEMSTSVDIVLDLKKRIDYIYGKMLSKNIEVLDTPMASNDFSEAKNINDVSQQLKKWRSISDLKIEDSEKKKNIEKLRELFNKGESFVSYQQAKPLISIDEFTSLFNYIEDISDYSGPFLVSLIKTEEEFSNISSNFKVDFSQETNKCVNGNSITLFVFDIVSSQLNYEAKKFTIVLDFDKMNGVLKFRYVKHPKGENISNRQFDEIEKFCKIKKIIYK